MRNAGEKRRDGEMREANPMALLETVTVVLVVIGLGKTDVVVKKQKISWQLRIDLVGGSLE